MEIVVYIHNGILLTIKRNTYESVLMKWMNLGLIIQSEISQKRKKYCVLMHTSGIWKEGTNNPTCMAAKETQK